MSDKTDPNVPDGETPTVMGELISTDRIGRNVMAALGRDYVALIDLSGWCRLSRERRLTVIRPPR